MRSYHWKLALFVVITMTIGNFIPGDWKVIYGFCSGMACGAYFIPYVIGERMKIEIREMWRKVDD